MRFLYVAHDLLQATTISSDAKLVGAAIRFLAKPKGICEESYNDIGAMVGLSKRDVMGAIPELTAAGFIVSSGGGNGTVRRFSVPPELLQDQGLETGAETAPVRKQDRSGNGTGPVPKSNRTTTESVSLYKEEKNNKNKSASGDADTSLTLSKLQQKWFDEEFWPLFWQKRDKAEAIEAFKDHVTSEAKKNQIVAAVKAQASEMLQRPLQFRPYAATWLHKRRYEDDSSSSHADLGAEANNSTYRDWKPHTEEPPDA